MALILYYTGHFQKASFKVEESNFSSNLSNLPGEFQSQTSPFPRYLSPYKCDVCAVHKVTLMINMLQVIKYFPKIEFHSHTWQAALVKSDMNVYWGPVDTACVKSRGSTCTSNKKSCATLLEFLAPIFIMTPCQ